MEITQQNKKKGGGGKKRVGERSRLRKEAG
jgi:hypothetical protein